MIKVLLCSVLFAFTGCALESEIYDKINPSMFPQNEADVKAMVTANAYNVFASDKYNGIFSVATGYVTISDVVTDQMEISWVGWDYRYNSYEANDWYVDGSRSVYEFGKSISSMILTVDRIKDVKMDQDLKDRYTAEIKCGMGFLAFLLYDLYGPIPLPDLETLKDPTKEKILPRATEDEMRIFIEGNLVEAAKVLPYRYEAKDYGRFTKGLANTLLLKFYMRTGDWNKAEGVGRDLTTNANYGYKLANDYYSLFALNGENNTEVIFAATAMAGAMENNWHAHIFPGDFPAPDGVTKWGGFKLAWPFYDSFDPKDKRREKIYAEYVGTDGTEHSRLNDRDNGSMGVLYYGAVPGKYGFEGVIGENSEIDLVIYRYADVMTLYAEALVRKNNSVHATAVGLLNEVRTKHGGLKAYTMGEVSHPEVFLDRMLEERGYEFYFEGVRRQDLLRHGEYITKAVEKAQFAGKSTEKIETKVNGQYKYERFPLPTKVITEGKGMIVQNPGF